MPPIDPAVARLLCFGFDGPALNDHARRLLDLGAGGVCLFARNVICIEQIADLITALRRHAGRPLYIAVDHEGGRVFRFPPPFTAVPPMRRLGATRDPHLARAIGRILGTELAACDIDLNLAPVLDVDLNPANPVIGPRSLSSEPAIVAALGAALIQGIQSTGTAACAKHYPGHGDTDTDSHHTLPTVRHNLDRLRAIELPPFAAAITAGVRAIMTAHILHPALDPHHPATLSPHLIDQLLRREMAFHGVILTDDLEMKAIADTIGIGPAAVAAITAGVDAVLVCREETAQLQALEALQSALDDGRLTRARLAASAARLATLPRNKTLPRPPLTIIGSQDHQTIAARIANTGA